MKKVILLIFLLVPIFFGRPEGYEPLGAWCTPRGEPRVVRPFNLESIWSDLKRDHPKADALINFTFTPLKYDLINPIYCGDIAVRKSK
ncbi:MAG: hypothetical protein IH874_08550 [Candidatus Dadabacteria bacterium]|nr:hypothetical protein [Candidatus Dadabacteria bacterium]